MDQTAYWVGLSLVPGVGPARFRRLVERLGGAEQAWKASALQLAQAGMDRRTIESLLPARGRVDLDQEMAKLDRMHVSVLTLDSDEYPERMRTIADPPPVLYVWGEIVPEDDLSVAIVGTRKASSYGRQAAEQFARGLAENRITVVSGLARGIDTYAHRAALEAHGRTVAVLGSGLDIIYPGENRALAAEIATGGAVVSEFPLGTKPDAMNFPRRNRIISGLSSATLVVEAGETSGALITAEFALEQGREVFAVPGNIFSPASRGPNQLLADGAHPACELRDILEVLKIEAAVEHREARQAIPETDTEAALLRCLSHEPQHIDEIRRTVCLPMSVVSSTLAMLELKGMARQMGGMNYVRG
ncbi:MAG TPA: DNA-processing protein DprA [Chloroflexota bacterium]